MNFFTLGVYTHVVLTVASNASIHHKSGYCESGGAEKMTCHTNNGAWCRPVSYNVQCLHNSAIAVRLRDTTTVSKQINLFTVLCIN